MAQTLDLDQLRQEARRRWFNPPEIFGILGNHSKYRVNSEPPVRPPAGSLFLFNRKTLRHFRKDGHNWRKKQDRKTVRETHEKLKMRGVDTLHCYYAHGEDNENFQRRIYWMLDLQLEHIVFVHYRDINEGRKMGPAYRPNAGSQLGSDEPSSASLSDWNDDGSDSENGDRDCACHGSDPDIHPFQAYVTNETLLRTDNFPGFMELPAAHNLISGLADGSYISSTSSRKFYRQKTSDILSRKVIDARLGNGEALQDASINEDRLFPNTHGVEQVFGASSAIPENSALGIESFGRWMDRGIVASNSAGYWNALDIAPADNENSSLSRHVLLDTNSVGPSLSQKQLFSISDISPVCAYSGIETMVLVMGTFLVDKKASDKWCCMFGEIEVLCDVLSENMIRCRVPLHAPGRVSFYVTCGNRIACSEVREFEFLKTPSIFASPLDSEISPQDVIMQIRLAKLLYLDLEKKWLNCSDLERAREKCKMKTKLCTLRDGMEKAREKFEQVVTQGTCTNFKDIVIQDLLKDYLYECIVCTEHEGNKGLLIMDDEGQGIIHLTASLGYAWALGPIVSAGVSPNFRDKRGRTSLHWASYFGREETIIELINLGASAGAIDDPTAEFPGGRKAADVASDRGHKGIARFLAETDLTAHRFPYPIKMTR